MSDPISDSDSEPVSTGNINKFQSESALFNFTNEPSNPPPILKGEYQMTKLALIASLFLSTDAFAEITDLPKGTIALNSVTAEVINQGPLCPDGATCITNGTIVTLS